MVLDPRSTDEVTTDLQDSLRGKIAKLTSFVESSFNDLFVRVFGDELHELETRTLAAQLSGYVDYAGRDDLDETDLDRLGIDGAEPAEINQYMESSQLDRLAPIVGVERDPGERATGRVTVSTATDDTRVPEGMEVATQPGPDGENLTFLVDADSDGVIEDSGFVTPDAGQTTVEVDVIAAAIGDEYNVGAGAVTFLPSPPPGVEGVTNNTEISGGQDEQSDAEFREDIKSAVFDTSGGGTARGIEGFIENNVDGVSDVAIDEFPTRTPPTVDVIVDGGSESEVETAIDDSRPVGIQHTLVRPEVVGTAIEAEVIGSSIDTLFIEDRLTDFLTDLTIGDEFRRSRLTQRLLNIDDNILDIGSLSVLIESIDGESETYQSGTTQYELDFAPLGDVDREQFLFRETVDVYELFFDDIDAGAVEVTARVGEDRVTLTQGTDYAVVDDNSDGQNDSIDFSIGGLDPDVRTTVEVSYEHASATIDSTITDETGTDFTQGTDWQLIDADNDGLDDTIDWGIGGSSPADGDLYFVDYEPKRAIARDLSLTKREKIGAGSTINATAYEPNT